MTSHTSVSLSWYVVRTKPKQERRAELNLHAWGVDTLAPWLREPWHSPLHQGLSYRVTPLFPGYIFARFMAELAVKVRLTRGVHSVVGFGEYGTPVDESVIALVRGRLGNDGFVHIPEPSPGDRVEIVAGPLRSLSGVFERPLSCGDRVLILLTTVGAAVRVQVPKSYIRRSGMAALNQTVDMRAPKAV